MKQITKKDLGKKLGTAQWYGCVSIKRFEKGHIIKPVKQEPIFVSYDVVGMILEVIANENAYYTLTQARKMLVALEL